VFALTRHFLQQSAKQLGVEPKRISEPALQQLSEFGFPGNVRQLENICHWLTVMAPSQVIEPKDLPPEIAPAPSTPAAHAAPSSPVAERASTSSAEVPSATALNGTSQADSSWESSLEAEAFALLAGDNRAAHHQGKAHRGRAQARYWPQHHYPENPRAPSRVRVSFKRPIGLRPNKNLPLQLLFL
jgi:DNA-binding NtrC family response regulator